MVLFKYVIIILIIGFILYAYNTIIEKRKERKIIENVNKQLLKHGKEPISIKRGLL